MNNIKGNLHNTKEGIINIKIRNLEGYPIHKAEFRIEDKRKMIEELNLLKDKFGINYIDIKGKFKILDIDQQKFNIQDELEHIREWREKSRGLREDKNIREKMKNLM